MAHYNTILNQITAILPRHEFYSLEKQFHTGVKFRSFNRWSQFMMMFIAQITGRKSLRDIIMNMTAQSSKVYHLGIKLCSHTQLARVNKKQPSELYERLFYNMLKRCQTLSPKHHFKFKGKIYLLDASIIDLYLASFPGQNFASVKERLRSMSGLTLMATFLNLLLLPQARSMKSIEPKPLICQPVQWLSSTWASLITGLILKIMGPCTSCHIQDRDT